MSLVAYSLRPTYRSLCLITRPLSTTPTRRRDATQAFKDTLDTVNRKVGKGLASAIDTTESVVNKTKETFAGGSTKVKKTAEAGQKANTTSEARVVKDVLKRKI
ncbi:hypothetical protein BS47DRAFT_1347528 [Hydnum rufescens UP504]|uniref:Uncharacterized protein n=1 Tax=Hydnum rufescens UP504 TaxID=1448309 RepID=A0A9P6DQ71_9AGAM|nr:hypothetical protein BS47DRAFT_1347528 [Hydnum rufescens UP504]